MFHRHLLPVVRAGLGAMLRDLLCWQGTLGCDTVQPSVPMLGASFGLGQLERSHGLVMGKGVSGHRWEQWIQLCGRGYLQAGLVF